LEDQETLRRKDDYERGQRAEQIAALQRAVAEIIKELKEHRKEEQATWVRFERSLEDLKLWRAKMMGIAGIIAFIITTVWHLLLMARKVPGR
jgi:erythromycin esterase-like protein